MVNEKKELELTLASSSVFLASSRFTPGAAGTYRNLRRDAGRTIEIPRPTSEKASSTPAIMSPRERRVRVWEINCIRRFRAQHNIYSKVLSRGDPDS